MIVFAFQGIELVTWDSSLFAMRELLKYTFIHPVEVLIFLFAFGSHYITHQIHTDHVARATPIGTSSTSRKNTKIVSLVLLVQFLVGAPARIGRSGTRINFRRSPRCFDTKP